MVTIIIITSKIQCNIIKHITTVIVHYGLVENILMKVDVRSKNCPINFCIQCPVLNVEALSIIDTQIISSIYILNILDTV